MPSYKNNDEETSVTALAQFNMPVAAAPSSTLSPAQQKLKDVCEEQMKCEFAT